MRAVLVLVVLGCIAFSYAWGVGVGWAMGYVKGRLDRRFGEWLDRGDE